MKKLTSLVLAAGLTAALAMGPVGCPPQEYRFSSFQGEIEGEKIDFMGSADKSVIVVRKKDTTVKVYEIQAGYVQRLIVNKPKTDCPDNAQDERETIVYFDNDINNLIQNEYNEYKNSINVYRQKAIGIYKETPQEKK